MDDTPAFDIRDKRFLVLHWCPRKKKFIGRLLLMGLQLVADRAGFVLRSKFHQMTRHSFPRFLLPDSKEFDPKTPLDTRRAQAYDDMERIHSIFSPEQLVDVIFSTARDFMLTNPLRRSQAARLSLEEYLRIRLGRKKPVPKPTPKPVKPKPVSKPKKLVSKPKQKQKPKQVRR